MSVAFDFHGRSFLVTGASSGIGRAAAVALRGCGARVVAAARNARASSSGSRTKRAASRSSSTSAAMRRCARRFPANGCAMRSTG